MDMGEKGQKALKLFNLWSKLYERKLKTALCFFIFKMKQYPFKLDLIKWQAYELGMLAG